MTHTKGNVIVENIKIGDIHYEYFYGLGIKVEVISAPRSEERESDVYWTWQAKDLTSGRVIDYGVSSKHAHYGPNLYDYEAYTKM